MRIGREGWILGVLLLIFIASTAYFSGHDVQEEKDKQPSTYNTHAMGLAGYYRLAGAQGLKVSRWECGLAALSGGGLLIIAEPLEREISPQEAAAVWRWVERGGALLVLVPDDPLQSHDKDPLLERVRVTDKGTVTAEIAPEPSGSPYVRGVEELHVEGSTRLSPRDPETQKRLAADSEGPFALSWKRGKGNVIVVSAALGADNARLGMADNSVFFSNIAAAHASAAGASVWFDEYHQGHGAEVAEGGLWSAVGPEVRAAAWYLLAALVIGVYNANRRFGAARQIQAATYRPSREYVQSMAALYRRADAPDVALEVIFQAFLRDLSRRVDAVPDAPVDRIAELASQRFRLEAGPLHALLIRGMEIAGGQRASEVELVRLARQMEEYRRKTDIVRVA